MGAVGDAPFDLSAFAMEELKMPEQLLTLEQVAEYLNVDKFTVYRLLSDKDLPAFKVGNQWRFKRKLIENWLIKNSNVRRKDS